jgi:S1-C subfamily serine protease
VGNPFELESTVTAGIVSARGRSIGILDDSYRVESFIQTDAAVNPGNSGGALCNTAGELIGINTAIVTRSGRYEGYSFAIPANLVRKVVRDLREYGMVQRAILGIATSEVDAKRAKELKLPNIEGVFLENVSTKGSADEAGLKKGDVIVSINGNKTRTVPELQELVARQRPGNKIEIEYFREGEKKKTTALLKNKSNSTTLVESVDTRVLETLGFEARELTVSEKRRLKVEGVMVKSVIKGSTIDRTHMDPGFIILEVNGKQVKNIADLVNHLNELRGEIFLEGIYENFEDEWVYKFKK